MGLELVGGAKSEGSGQAEGPGHGRLSESGANRAADTFAAAEMALAGARRRLSDLADRLAEVKRRLDSASSTRDSMPPSA